MCWWTVASRDIISTTPTSPDFATDWNNYGLGHAIKNITRRGGVLNGTAQGVPRGHVVDAKGGEVTSSGRSSRTTAFREGCRSSTPASNHAAANRLVRTRWKNSCSYGAVYACRQRTANDSVGKIDVYGGVSVQQGAALCDRHAVSVQNATRDRAGTSSSSRHDRAYSRHRLKKLRNTLIRQSTAWTTTTTIQTTTFCAIFAIVLPCRNRLLVLPLTTSP